MTEPAPPEAERKPAQGRWLGVALFLFAIFMYVSIMIKIIKYGP
jgi:hypothetical protein